MPFKLFLPLASQPATPAQDPAAVLPTPISSPPVIPSPELSSSPASINEPLTPAPSSTTSPEPPASRSSGRRTKHAPSIRLPACLACRKKKRKCDHQLPCSLCSRLNQECKYDSHPNGKRAREKEEAEAFIKQWEAGGAMRPFMITENPASVSLEPGQALVEPDVVEVDATGQPIRSFVAVPAPKIVDTTQWPRKKKFKKSYSDPPLLKPVFPILSKPEPMASVPIPLTPPSQPDLSSFTPPPEPTDSFSEVDMDAILRGIQSVTPDAYTGVLGNGEVLPNGGSTSEDTHTRAEAGESTFPDVAGLEQTSNSTESDVLQTHDFDFAWIDKLGAELLNGLKEIIPPFSDNLVGGTDGEIAGEATTSNLLDGGFHLGDTVGNDPFAASASDESYTNITGHVTEIDISPLSGSNTDQPTRAGYIDIDAALKNLLG